MTECKATIWCRWLWYHNYGPSYFALYKCRHAMIFVVNLTELQKLSLWCTQAGTLSAQYYTGKHKLY
jgi:hypothetical protein